MATEIMEFTRGDGIDHTFAMPANIWTPGGTLFFAAKLAIDDDATDAAAKIKHTWNDTVVSDVTINGIAYKKYTCHFPGSATSGIQSGGADELEYLGEFQWVPAGGGDPITYPANNNKIDVIVYPDIVLETS